MSAVHGGIIGIEFYVSVKFENTILFVLVVIHQLYQQPFSDKIFWVLFGSGKRNLQAVSGVVIAVCKSMYKKLTALYRIGS